MKIKEIDKKKQMFQQSSKIISVRKTSAAFRTSFYHCVLPSKQRCPTLVFWGTRIPGNRVLSRRYEL
eukprot:2610893-Rhodomonas_salina.1